MFKKLVKRKFFRFLVCGFVTASFNIFLIYSLINFLGFDTPFLRNMANVLAIEVSLIFSFFVYKNWVWSGGKWTVREVLWKQIPLYHVSVGATVTLRSLVLFPILDWLGVNYAINTLLGVLLGSFLNYFSNDKVVFKAK